MPYSVGERGSYGCSGYPVVKDGTSDVMGCHKTKEAAANQIAAIEANETEKVGIKDPQAWPGTEMGKPKAASKYPKKKRKTAGGVGGDPSGAVATTGGGTSMGTKNYSTSTEDDISRVVGKDGAIKEGDFVMGETTAGTAHGVVEHIMWEGGTLGTPGSDYALESMPPENPAMSVRIYEEDEEEAGVWGPTPYSIGMMYADATVYDMNDHDMDDHNEEEMEYTYKAESYTPTGGMKAAARRALKWKEDGKAKGAGTAVGWGRASDIVAGRSMSLSVVKRMYSFFSRHEVDKKGKGFYDGPNFPSKGRVMWDAWGGDAGFSWSRKIAEREREKALFADFGKDFTKSQRLTEIKGLEDKEKYHHDEDEMKNKASSVRVGQMVSWNSSGGTARGKVKRIISNGSYNVPGTEITINGTPEDPAVVITLYRDGDATDTIVAHRRSTLRAA